MEFLSEATPPRSADQLDGLPVSPFRLDLGRALDLAVEVLATDSRPGEVTLLSDLQASAGLRGERYGSARRGTSRRQTAEEHRHRWTGGWSTTMVDRWRPVDGVLVGDSGASVPVAARLGNRPARQVLAPAGGSAVFPIMTAPPGWWTVTADLDPDELRIDDRRLGAVRIAPVARVNWDSASRYIGAACAVLETNRRIARGNEVAIGRLANGSSIVTPPEDPAALGALNRALAARGVGWSFGELVTTPATTDSGTIAGRFRVLRHYQLRPSGSGRTGVLVTVGGSPWLARSGNVVLLGSRLDPDWTDLPVSAGFMPFMDALLNRLARGEVALTAGIPGDPVQLPDFVTGVRQGERGWRVEGGGFFRPHDPGVYYLVAGDDTVGAVSANIDSRESLLTRATDTRVKTLWRGARPVVLEKAGAASFSSAARGDLRGPLLWLALLLGLLEMVLASALRRREA